MLDGDELAGVVSQFGALSRPELVRAAEELAFKRGEDVDPDRVGDAIDGALADLRLVAVQGGTTDAGPTGAGAADAGGDESGSESGGTGTGCDAALLVPGPTAFPRLPDGAEDLPHILDVEARSVADGAAAEAAERRLRAAAATAVADGDRERMAGLLDATYDLESWASDADVASVRERLDAALDSEGGEHGDGG
ncbi:MAG: hypothetical protein ABEH40_02370 [Haloferacaceae archaeon]